MKKPVAFIILDKNNENSRLTKNDSFVILDENNKNSQLTKKIDFRFFR